MAWRTGCDDWAADASAGGNIGNDKVPLLRFIASTTLDCARFTCPRKKIPWAPTGNLLRLGYRLPFAPTASATTAIPPAMMSASSISPLRVWPMCFMAVFLASRVT